jgi:hypothetical protein
VAALAVAAVVGAGPSDGLAGSRAGVGREHPGRGRDDAVPLLIEPDAVTPVLVMPETPEAGRTEATSGGDVVLEVLPMGVGLTLMGAGLGFLGWRLRRGV